MATQRAYNHQYEYQTSVRPKVAVKKKVNPRTKIHRKVFLWTLLFTGAALFLLSLHAEVDDTRRELRNITAELHAIETANEHLQRQIDRSINLSELEQYAISELGMRRVEAHQIFNIDMNTSDNVGEIISHRGDTVPLEEGVLYGVPGVLIRAFETLR